MFMLWTLNRYLLIGMFDKSNIRSLNVTKFFLVGRRPREISLISFLGSVKSLTNARALTSKVRKLVKFSTIQLCNLLIKSLLS